MLLLAVAAAMTLCHFYSEGLINAFPHVVPPGMHDACILVADEPPVRARLSLRSLADLQRQPAITGALGRMLLTPKRRAQPLQVSQR
jgi:hypothetical protein